jgi:hypothetical protein
MTAAVVRGDGKTVSRTTKRSEPSWSRHHDTAMFDDLDDGDDEIVEAPKKEEEERQDG